MDNIGFYKMKKAIASLLFLLPLTAHANPDQTLTLRVEPDTAGPAHCLIHNASTETVAYHVPHTLIIERAAGPTEIRCESDNGLWHGRIKIVPNATGEIGDVINLPFVAFNAANDAVNDFDEPMSQAVGGAVRFPDVISVPMVTDVTTLPDAVPVDNDVAIDNQPQAPVVITPVAPPVTKPVHHHRHVYRVTESHS